MRLMKITLRNKEIITAMNALEMYIALHLGRYGDIIMMYRFLCCEEALENIRTWTEECESHLKHIRDMLMPDLRDCTLNGANRGIFQPIVDDRARDAYDMLQCIRYTYAWYKKPEGGQGVDFYQPMIRGRYPEPKCRAYRGDCVDVELCDEQIQVLLEALRVCSHINHGEIRQAFMLYTDNADALDTAEKIEPLLPRVDDQYIEDTDKLLHRIGEEK